MAIPTRTLQAAGRWLHLLRGGSHSQAKSLLWNNAQYQDLSRDQYDRGLALLNNMGLYFPGEGLRNDLSWASGEQLKMLFAADVIAEDLPPWLEDGVVEGAIVDPPTEAMDMVSALDLDEHWAPEIIRRAHGKVDLQMRAAVGAAGEEALTALLLQSGVNAVEQISAYDDGAGFDLCVNVNDAEYHLEVKSTSKMRSLRIFLSRNEYEVSTRDPSWRLVTVGLDDKMQIAALATIDQATVRRNVPSDMPPVGRWASSQLLLSNSHLTRGLHLGHIEVQGNSSDVWWA